MSTKHNPTPERERPQVFLYDEKQSTQAKADHPTSQQMVQRPLAMTTDPSEVTVLLLGTLSQRKEGIGFLLRRMGVSALVALALLVSLMSATAPRAAASPGPFGWGYVWADQPSSALYTSYTPNPSYQFNLTGATNTITHTGTGAYTVSFPNLGVAAGTVHVTAYGSGTEFCKVANWGPSGTTQQVNVRCFNNSGAPVDAYYTVTYVRPPSTSQPMAYVWADQPSWASYTPNLSYQFNSTGATNLPVYNTITRTGIGAYVVRLPGLGESYGHVQVTAYGYGSERCKVAIWGPSGTTQQVYVRCFTSAGSPVDTRYTLTYVKDTSIVSSSYPSVGAGTVSAYAWADQPSSASYTPNLRYQFNYVSGVTNTITRLGTGSYAVNFPGQNLSSGDVQVTAYGSGSEFCKVAYWNPSAGVRVKCFDSTGTPKDTDYDVTFLSSWIVG